MKFIYTVEPHQYEHQGPSNVLVLSGSRINRCHLYSKGCVRDMNSVRINRNFCINRVSTNEVLL